MPANIRQPERVAQGPLAQHDELPIPPLDEQREVLAKPDALTEQAGLWREQFQRKQRLALLLAGATVAAFTEIAIEQQEDEPMKAPQTEDEALA